jgi:phosphoribosylamine-glycine ligase
VETFRSEGNSVAVMTLGIGAFAHSAGGVLADAGASVSTYLTRDYGHFPPTLVGPTFTQSQHPSPVPLMRERGVQLVLPQSIDWARAPWADDLLAAGIGILCATGEGMRIERERDFARELCARYGVPFPRSHVAASHAEADAILARERRPFVIKNPLCSPGSPIHTIVCETVAETRAWLPHLNYAEGAFLQEYAGRAEAGHIAFVSAGEIRSLVTNQEYKRAFAGNLGIVAGAPLGGIVERDEEDKYGLARELLHPLRPWFRAVGFHGPIQVTAARHEGRWQVLEYNIRIGVTSGAMILRMLENPIETLLATVRNAPLAPRWRAGTEFGCSVTLAGYGYPFTQIVGPPMPIETDAAPDGRTTDLWWNEVGRSSDGQLLALGHRLADAVGYGADLSTAIARAYATLRRVRTTGSYYRNDVGRSLWPPGNV